MSEDDLYLSWKLGFSFALEEQLIGAVEKTRKDTAMSQVKDKDQSNIRLYFTMVSLVVGTVSSLLASFLFFSISQEENNNVKRHLFKELSTPDVMSVVAMFLGVGVASASVTSGSLAQSKRTSEMKRMLEEIKGKLEELKLLREIEQEVELSEYLNPNTFNRVKTSKKTLVREVKQLLADATIKGNSKYLNKLKEELVDDQRELLDEFYIASEFVDVENSRNKVESYKSAKSNDKQSVNSPSQISESSTQSLALLDEKNELISPQSHKDIEVVREQEEDFDRRFARAYKEQREKYRQKGIKFPLEDALVKNQKINYYVRSERYKSDANEHLKDKIDFLKEIYPDISPEYEVIVGYTEKEDGEVEGEGENQRVVCKYSPGLCG